MRHMKERMAFVVTACLLAATAGSAPGGAARIAFGQNLVVNGNAEAGPGSPNDGAKLMPIPGWKRMGTFTVIQYGGSGGFPDKNSPGPSNRGKNFFAGGPGSPKDQTSASQLIDVSTLSAGLKSGKAKFSFSAYIGGFASQADYGYVTAAFLDSNGKRVGSAKLGPVTTKDRKSVTGLYSRSTSGRVPALTRKVIVEMVSVRKEGSFHDGYFDNIELNFVKG